MAYLNPLSVHVADVVNAFQIEHSKEELHESTDDSRCKILVTTYTDVINEGRKLISEFLGASQQPNIFHSLRYTDAQIMTRVCRSLLERRPQDYFLLFCIFVIDICAKYWVFLAGFKSLFDTVNKNSSAGVLGLDMHTKTLLEQPKFAFKRVSKQDLDRALHWFEKIMKTDVRHETCQKFIQIIPTMSIPSFKALSILSPQQTELAKAIVQIAADFAHQHRAFVIQTRIIRFLEFASYLSEVHAGFEAVSESKRSAKVLNLGQNSPNQQTVPRDAVTQNALKPMIQMLFGAEYDPLAPDLTKKPDEKYSQRPGQLDLFGGSADITPQLGFVPSSRMNPNPKTGKQTALSKERPPQSLSQRQLSAKKSMQPKENTIQQIGTALLVPEKPICCFCDMPVRGLFRLFPKCKHGGHVEHFNSWLEGRTHKDCPRC